MHSSQWLFSLCWTLISFIYVLMPNSHSACQVCAHPDTQTQTDCKDCEQKMLCVTLPQTLRGFASYPLHSQTTQCPTTWCPQQPRQHKQLNQKQYLIMGVATAGRTERESEREMLCRYCPHAPVIPNRLTLAPH